MGELQTRKATKLDQVSPTLDPVTHSLGDGGVTDKKSNQSGSSEPHPGPSDPFPGGGGSYRQEKQPNWIKWAPPWTHWPVPWGRGKLQTRKATKSDHVSPTLTLPCLLFHSNNHPPMLIWSMMLKENITLTSFYSYPQNSWPQAMQLRDSRVTCAAYQSVGISSCLHSPCQPKHQPNSFNKALE